jgi:hypothetical protein
MRTTFGVAILTACLTLCWLSVRPFRYAAVGLSRVFHGGRQEANLTQTYRETATQEVTKGEAPLSGLRRLGERWNTAEPLKRLVFMGNSQTYTVVLAPDERVPNTPPKTYVDLLADRTAAEGWSVYRLSAPNLSYPEALWYVTYLCSVAEVRPTEIVLQLNYQSFRLTGIRDGMLELLEEPRFARMIDELAGSSAPYAGVMAQAKRRYMERKKERAGNRDDRRTAELGFGKRAERNLREWLNTQPAWTAKHETKADILDFLYLSRVYFLGITPTTRRPLGGSYGMNMACLEGVAAKCRANGIVLKLFLAPQNPKAQLWRTEGDRAQYRTGARTIADRYGLALVDLENVVPAPDWGAWIDGPDPIHFGLEGHRLMAEAVLRSDLFR